GRLGGYRDGTELHTGLNIIPVTADGTNYCINYVVKTFDTSKGTGKKAIIEGRELSNYPDLQIHIEGGYINGYWNKMGDANHDGDFNYPADTDNDWNYIKERATQTDVTVLGEYVTLQFPLTDAGTGDDKGMATFFNSYKDKTTSLEASIEEWDNVMIWERLLMGVLGEDVIEKEDKKSPYSDELKVTAYTGNDGDDFGCDYSEYYRIHGLSFGTEGGYMYGGWDHCGYNFNTMESVMLSIIDEAGPHWGPAHEIGHQHQGPLNMRGLTEVTNNLFSNVVLWYFGKSTSRYNGTEGSLSNVLQQFNAEGTDFFSNNIWAQTIMYYKLFLYYHVLGHNPKFYPRLFEMLRQNPMAIEYNQDGGKCLMHFYKLCCDAAGEDLTEFFRAHGFFRVMEDRFVGDYSNAVYNMTQAQIDAAIQEVKDLGYKENIAVLFINDATGETIKSHKGDNLEQYGETTICSEIGSYASFATATAPSYNYTISGNSVTMEGTGGVGFAILNENGELIGFSDKTTFELSDETMEALSNGSAKVVVMPATGEPVEATATMSESEIKRTLLVELIAQAEALDALTDTEGKKIGFYKSSYMTDLHNALTKAQEVVENNTVSAYTPVFNALKAAIDDLKSKEFAKITMKPGTYTVRNLAYTTRYLSVNGSNEVVTSTNATPTESEKWVFEQGDGNNVYYLKNLSTSKYVNALAQSTVVSATTANVADAKGWLVEDLGNGVFGITCQDENNQAMHSAANASYKIVGWNTGATASRWYLTALETEQLSAEQQALEELIALSEDILERVANIETLKERVELNENSYYCNAPHKSGGDALTTYAVLYDNNYETFLHTDYSGTDSEDKLDHYLRVDLGEGNSASLFTFNYASRSNGNQNPTAITIEGCNTAAGEYELITTLTRDADKLISGGDSEYHSAVMGLSSKSYRFLRFTVTGTMQGATAGPSDSTETPDVNEENKHVFFVFSEFGVSKATCNVTALPKYSTLTNDDVTAAFNAIREAKFAYANATQADDYTKAYNALKDDYDKLVDAYDTGDQTALSTKKEELQTLINNTTALIGECGSVEYTEETTPQLNTSAAPYKLSDNNGASQGSLDKLY
ncbi:MAG: M60 family metallopeptidase, partial [Prevotellamassilia sp.]|nr:M60 family metallopeptidase [Prevotellamassilia sp.]